jgi:hypothetical protein
MTAQIGTKWQLKINELDPLRASKKRGEKKGLEKRRDRDRVERKLEMGGEINLLPVLTNGTRVGPIPEILKTLVWGLNALQERIRHRN